MTGGKGNDVISRKLLLQVLPCFPAPGSCVTPCLLRSQSISLKEICFGQCSSYNEKPEEKFSGVETAGRFLEEQERSG